MTLWKQAVKNYEESAIEIYKEQGYEKAVEYIGKVVEKYPDFLFGLALNSLIDKIDKTKAKRRNKE